MLIIPFHAFARIKMRPVASLVFSVRNSVVIKLAIFILLCQNAVHSNQVLSILKLILKPICTSL